MTDQEIRKLMQKSIIKTSDKFTEDLMHKVELQKNSEKKTRTHFLIACSICIVLSLFLFKLSATLSFLHVQLNLSRIVIRVFGSLFVFLMLHRLMVLRSELLKSEKNIL